MKRLRTTPAAVALAATASVAPAASAASAAVPDSGATANASRSAVAARIGNHGMFCYGKAVRRCVWFQHDSTNPRFRAYAGIRDVAGGHNWSVKVTNVHLVGWSTGRNVGKMNNDYDGWHHYVDHARGPWVRCQRGKTYHLDAWAHFAFRGYSQDDYSTGGSPVYVKC